MQITTKAIVLSALKYGDSSLIVRAYTEAEGLRSYLLKGILNAKKGKLKSALFQPLTQLELVAVHKNKGSLERIREAKVSYAYHSLHTDIVKNSMVLFLAEMLTIAIQEEEHNPGLYAYLEYALTWLDTQEGIANFHILFLLNLTKYLGCYPDTTRQELPYFDLQEAHFTTVPTLNPMLQEEQLVLFRRFLGINFDAVNTIRTNNNLRQELLKKVLLYFELHLHGFRKPKSLAVLNAVFN